MHPDVVRAQIARIGVSAPHKFSSALVNFDLGANPEAVSVSRFQANQEPVISVEGSSLVQQQPHWAIVVGYQNVDGAVVVDIPESSSAAYLGTGQGGPSNSGYLAKLLSMTFVVEQLIDLVERIGAPAQGLHAVHGATGDKQIQMTIIVIIKPFGTEAGVGQGRAEQVKFNGSIVEVSMAIVDVEIATFVGQVGFEDVLIAVIAKISGGHTHASLRRALSVIRSSR